MSEGSQIEHLVEPVSTYLLPLLEDALLACAERHRIADGQGADNFSFGTDAWSLPARQFRDAIETGSIPFSIAPERGCVLAFDAHRVRHHRVGWSEVDNIATSFPGNAQGLRNEFDRARQVEIEFPDYEPPPVGGIVLAYMANPGAGLCAAYLARVGRIEHGKIVEWAETHELFRRDNPPEPTEVRTTVAAEQVPVPVVRRTAKKSADAGR